MAKVLGIVSGKGGVGKTIVSLNLGLALNNFGRRVVVVDGDLFKPNLAVNLGLKAKEENTIHRAINEGRRLDEMVYVHSSGLKLIPGDSTVMELDKKLHIAKQLLEEMKSCEVVILDIPSGFGEDVNMAIKACDALIVVVTPDAASMQDGLKTIRLAGQIGVTVLGIAINRSEGTPQELTSDDVSKVTGRPVLVVIPEDNAMVNAQRFNQPLVHLIPDSPATTSFKKLAATLLGEKYAETLKKEDEHSALKALLKKLGF